jgi:hypothetical protein
VRVPVAGRGAPTEGVTDHREHERARPLSRTGPSACVGGDARIRTGDKGFAGPCLATWRRRPLLPASRGLFHDEGWFRCSYALAGPSPRLKDLWSGRRDSNPRPQPWQGCALPAEPRPHAPQAQVRSLATGYRARNTSGPGPDSILERAGPRSRRRGGAPDDGCYNTPRCALGGSRANAVRYHTRALSSGGEHFLDAEGVVGSNPTAPTMNATEAPAHQSRGLLLCAFGAGGTRAMRATRPPCRRRSPRGARRPTDACRARSRWSRSSCPGKAGA